MKKILIFLLFPLCVNSQNWNFINYYDGDGRHHPITFSNDRYGFVLCGQNGEGDYLNDFFKFDSQDESWIQLSDFPGGPRGYAYGISDSTYAYVGFGSNNNDYPNDWWKYDMINDNWEELSPFPYLGRHHPAMILTNNKIFVGMGSIDGQNLGDWWEFDIESNIWTQKTDFPFGDRHHPFYFSINNVPYVGFGHGNSINNNINIYNDFYKYDIDIEQWIKLSDFPSEARVAGTQFSFNDKGYVLSGDGDDHGPLDSGELWEYNPEIDEWTQLQSHPGGARWAPGSFTIGCQVFLTSGFEAETGIYHNDLQSLKLSDECGCTQEDAFNYNSDFLINDNSCCYVSGCTDSNSINYNEFACYDDDSCIPIYLGCDDMSASNYDSLANTSISFAGPNFIDLGQGGYHYNDMWDMVFNCYENVKIKSIDVYAETSFSSQIEILDINNDQIFSSDVSLQEGLNQIEINYLILEGNEYKIGINGENQGLYRNNNIEENTFPINLLNVIDITSNTTDSPQDYFYYFYNWQLEIECNFLGCTDILACNYDINATNNDGSCEYAIEYYDCNGTCLSDQDLDSVCDELEILGCDDSLANNYNPDATDNDGSCIYPIYGCTDILACNYDINATNNDDSCEYAIEYYDCNGFCLNDQDFDGICDQFDNCPEDYNPNQDDYDTNNIGDACDSIYLLELDINKNVVMVVDYLGRPMPFKSIKKPIFYIYRDGSVKKNIFFK
ncbi:MAG: hypothetical protein CMP65_05495 [Flavobacteriales bacterium]|nr:hypothetical protein [Flavobacteriales bacterium]